VTRAAAARHPAGRLVGCQVVEGGRCPPWARRAASIAAVAWMRGGRDRRVALQARDLHVGECLDERRVEADGVRCGDPGRSGDGPVVEDGGDDDAEA
jgi:hypothetical protein